MAPTAMSSRSDPAAAAACLEQPSLQHGDTGVQASHPTWASMWRGSKQPRSSSPSANSDCCVLDVDHSSSVSFTASLAAESCDGVESSLLACLEDDALPPTPSPVAGPARRCVSTPTLGDASAGDVQQALSDVREIIHNEAAKEAELRPLPCRSCTAESRGIVVSWMVEVASIYKLQQTTLFLSVSLFDRFLGLCEAIGINMLQLVAVSCMSLAVKQEEVGQMTSKQWAYICSYAYEPQDIVRMEWFVLCTLEWRTCGPTGFSFLQLLCNGLPTFPRRSKCYASYLLELSLLDQALLQVGSCNVAAAALLSAQCSLENCTEGHAFNVVLRVLPDLDINAVQAAAVRIAQLERAVQSGAARFDPIVNKYNDPQWRGSLYLGGHAAAPEASAAAASAGAQPVAA